MNISKVLFGRPLATHESPHQTIGKTVGLAVFASDALSSTAYATQEILVVLAGAAALVGTSVFGYSIAISVAIVALLVILTISYRQTIFAYPNGGGAYIVARDNLGEMPAQTAGAALLTDYILTVSVSISSGVDQVVSALPALRPLQVEICVLAVLAMMIINLRGVKESGRIFAVPTYFFVVTMFITLIVGFYRLSTGTLPQITGVEMVHHTVQNVSVFLILHAFSSGCTALTGVEAISNGITAFREPRSKNAAATMIAMSSILGVLFIGITFLANRIHALPSDTETIISQLARMVLGHSAAYGVVIGSTTVILIMAANTAFADFPRLCALHAGDGFLPRQLTFRGSRLVFSWGILVLALMSILLIIIFQAKTTRLIPLYAIGVFLSFTLSQAGMVVRWQKIGKIAPGQEVLFTNPHGEESRLTFDPQWRTKQLVNAAGAIMTFIVMCVFSITKFADGAWVTVFLIPFLVFVFFRIHYHYKDVGHSLSLSKRTVKPLPHNILSIVMVDDVHAGTVQMVEFAMSQGSPWIAVHIDIDPAKTARVLSKWEARMGTVQHELQIVPCPYRNMTEVAVDLVEEKMNEEPGRLIHVIMGQIIMDSWVAQALHANTSIAFKMAFQRMDGVIVTDVSYLIHPQEDALEQKDELVVA